jgi:hypothetical protein
MSIYHYGPTYPYDKNTIPEAGKFVGMMTDKLSSFNFYEMFSGSGVVFMNNILGRKTNFKIFWGQTILCY